jgi:hypothetical protein
MATLDLPVPPESLRIWVGPFSDAELFVRSGEQTLNEIVDLCGPRRDAADLRGGPMGRASPGSRPWSKKTMVPMCEPMASAWQTPSRARYLRCIASCSVPWSAGGFFLYLNYDPHSEIASYGHGSSCIARAGDGSRANVDVFRARPSRECRRTDGDWFGCHRDS